MLQPLVLISLDGFGISPIDDKNPIAMAKKPVMDDLLAHYPYGVLDASGIAVGLPWGEVGNSEVGHLNLGAGLVVYQSLPKIGISIENKTFYKNEIFVQAAEHVKKNKSRLHILGIASTGGVHGHIEHMKALLRFAKEQKIKDVFVHAITDGRDSAPQAGIDFTKDLQKTMKELKTGTVATLCGRYYAMDRNNAWDRTQRAYDLITLGTGSQSTDPIAALKDAYAKKIDDEMFEPVCIVDKKKNPLALIQDNDAMIFSNFREDRARQLARAIGVGDSFDGFKREKRPGNIFFTTMTEYEEGLPSHVAFPPQHIKKPFGAILAEQGMKQLRIAESEKYAHVTYFFNGGEEKTYPGEDRILIPSPKVKTYDLKPEMSAYEVADKLVDAIKKKKYDFCLVNFANPDMVGHTGNLEATIKAVEVVDECVGKVVEANKKAGGITMITADHGNAEGLIDMVTGRVDKEHSTTPVPFYFIDESRRKDRLPEEVEILKHEVNVIGILADVAPTMLDLIKLKASPEMTGRSLLNDLM